MSSVPPKGNENPSIKYWDPAVKEKDILESVIVGAKLV
jgi:hypothetical protein